MEAIPEHITRILDLARWAPSGDNTQPWRFEVLGDEHILIHGFDTREHCIYDLDGHASQLAVGALLETITIAATGQHRRTRIERRSDTPETHFLFDVRFTRDDSVMVDPLAAWIEKRVVQRRPMSIHALSADQKAAMAAALPEGFRVVWFEALFERWRLARFMFDNAKVRLILPEAYEVHRAVIEWNAQFSEDRIPDQAVGIDFLTARLMRWVMESWSRVDFFNTYLLGDFPPRIQLDLLPGLLCAAHFALVAPSQPRVPDDYLEAGRVLQRYWLTAASLGLYVQPEMTPVIFCRYHRRGLAFTRLARAADMVSNLNQRLTALLPAVDTEGLFFMGRIGSGPAPRSRSTRRPLGQLFSASSVQS